MRGWVQRQMSKDRSRRVPARLGSGALLLLAASGCNRFYRVSSHFVEVAELARALQLRASLRRARQGEQVSGSNETVLLNGGPASHQNTVYHELLREVFRNPVSRFASYAQVAVR